MILKVLADYDRIITDPITDGSWTQSNCRQYNYLGSKDKNKLSTLVEVTVIHLKQKERMSRNCF